MPTAESPLLIYVENELLTQHLVKGTLIDAGYDVRTANDGDEALELLASIGPPLDALITDVDLGDGPSGWQVAREARALFPALPVIYVSGASAHEWATLGVADSLIVTKPFSADQIVATVEMISAKANP